MSKHKPSAAVRTMIELLITEFPAAFSSTAIRKPSKVGIHEDIRQARPEIDAQRLSRALRMYTRCIPYLRGMVAAGAVRVDLAGSSVEPVSPEIAAQAVGWLAAARARRAAKGSPQAAPSGEPSGPWVLAALSTACAPAAAPTSNSSRLSLAGLRAAAQERRARAQKVSTS